MATSFAAQIEVVLNLMIRLNPRKVLDVGKGFGKYGFLLHEYYGVDSRVRPDPSKTLAEQSRVVIDAVESNPDYLWPHMSQLYRKVLVGRIEDLGPTLSGYDLVLFLDVIEHIQPRAGAALIRHFVGSGASMIISTPAMFFNQALYQSDDEHHVSFWDIKDIRGMGFPFDYQTVGPGRVFLVTPRPIDIRGFGHKPIKRLRRIARVVRSEFG